MGTLRDKSYGSLFAEIIGLNFEKINVEYINKMSQHIADIGKLTPSDLHILEQMARMDANVDEINKMLAKEAKIADAELDKIYKASGIEQYTEALPFYKASGKTIKKFEDNKAMQNYIKAVKKRSRTMTNLSKTTAVGREYKRVVDEAILAVSSGVSDYKSYMRKSLNRAVENGMKVEYASGYKRRLDSAVRMNILDGIRQVNNGVRLLAGQEFEADGVEIDAHGLCAPDHIGIQGKQKTMKEFEDFQSSAGKDHRPISELNCQHSYTPILLGISIPAFSDAELKQMQEYSEEIIDLDGKQLTRYQCSQVMRNLETEMRYAKENLIAGRNLGSDEYVAKYKRKIKRINKKYNDVCNKSKLKPRRDKMSITRNEDYRKKVAEYYRNAVKNFERKAKLLTGQKTEVVDGLTKKLRDQYRQDYLFAQTSTEKLALVENVGDMAIKDFEEGLKKVNSSFNKQLEKPENPVDYWDRTSEITNVYWKAGDDLNNYINNNHLDIDVATRVRMKDQIKDYIKTKDLTAYKDGGSFITKHFDEIYEDIVKQHISNEFLNENLSKYIRDYTQALFDYKYRNFKYLKLIKGEKISMNSKFTAQLNYTKEFIKKYRDVGYDPKEIKKHLKNSRSPVSPFVEQAYQAYPSTWVENSITYGNLSVRKVKRGYYNDWEEVIAISHRDDNQALTTSIHELGHRFERSQQHNIVEKELYNRRTAGESLEWLGQGYAKSEKTRKDNWLSPYMGKDYGGRSFEIDSMGFQYAYTDPEKLLQDREFAKYILGMLLIG